MLLGDSLAASLDVGLAAAEREPTTGSTSSTRASSDATSTTCPAIVDGNLDQPESTCRTWRTLWAQQVAQYRPDVVGLLVGRWDITDHLDHGQIVHIGQPAWNAHLYDEIDEAVTILSARGAKVVLFTMPYIDPVSATGAQLSREQPDPGRRVQPHREGGGAKRRGVATVIDLNRALDPGGRLPGRHRRGHRPVGRRDPHLRNPGGVWLQPFILPLVAQEGLDARVAGTAP